MFVAEGNRLIERHVYAGEIWRAGDHCKQADHCATHKNKTGDAAQASVLHQRGKIWPSFFIRRPSERMR